MKLECVQTTSDIYSFETFDFFFNGQPIHAIGAINNYDFELSTVKKILRKAVTAITDAGEYQCRTISDSLQSTINVHIFKGLTIVPELTNLWLQEGSSLKLECVYKRQDTDSYSPDTFDFYYNGQIIDPRINNEFSLSASKRVDQNLVITSSLKLAKTSTAMTDAGEYQCRTSSDSLQSTINVHIFKVTVTSDTLEDGDTSLILQCKPEGLNPADDVQINWSRNDSNITTNSKYKVYTTNSSLEILKPERSDMAQYQCDVVFYPGTDDEQHFMPPPLIVTGNFTVESSSNRNNAATSVVVIVALATSRLL